MTIRYGIRWDGKGGKRIAAVALASTALLAPAIARMATTLPGIGAVRTAVASPPCALAWRTASSTVGGAP